MDIDKKELMKQQLDIELESFKKNFRQSLLDGDYSTDLYHIEDVGWGDCVICATYDFYNRDKSVDAHVDVYYMHDKDENLAAASVHVWPRLGDGDPLANGEPYVYDITEPEVLSAVKDKCIYDVYYWFDD